MMAELSWAEYTKMRQILFLVLRSLLSSESDTLSAGFILEIPSWNVKSKVDSSRFFEWNSSPILEVEVKEMALKSINFSQDDTRTVVAFHLFFFRKETKLSWKIIRLTILSIKFT